MRYETEAGFQRAVIEAAQLLGWTTWWTPDSRRTESGEPDLRLLRPPRMIFAELKTDKGRVRPEQADALVMLGQCPGVEAYLWRPKDWARIVETLT